MTRPGLQGLHRFRSRSRELLTWSRWVVRAKQQKGQKKHDTDEAQSSLGSGCDWRVTVATSRQCAALLDVALVHRVRAGCVFQSAKPLLQRSGSSFPAARITFSWI